MPLHHAARAFVLAVVGVSNSTSSLDREECAVYAAYVDQRFSMVADSSEPLKRLIICDRTAALEMLRSWPNVVGHLSVVPTQDTIDDLVGRNKARYPLNHQIGFRLPHTVIPDGDIDRVFQRNSADGWLDFNKRYPRNHGILWLSRVGFSRDRDQALLYAGNQWTEAAGEGYLILLRKQAGVWKEINRATCWTS